MNELHYDIDTFYTHLSNFTTEILTHPNQNNVTIQVTASDLDVTSDIFLALLHKSLANCLSLITEPNNYLLTSEQKLQYASYYKSMKSAESIDISVTLLNIVVTSNILSEEERSPYLVLTRRTLLDTQYLDTYPFRNITLQLDNSLLLNCVLQEITSLRLINHSNCNLYVEDSDIPLTVITLDNSSMAYTSPYLLSHADNTHHHKTYAYLCTTLNSSMDMPFEQILSLQNTQPKEQEDEIITPWEGAEDVISSQKSIPNAGHTTLSNLRTNIIGKELISTVAYRKPCTIKISLNNSELLALCTQENNIVAYFDSPNTVLDLIADIQDRKEDAVQPVAEEYMEHDTEVLYSVLHNNIDKVYDIERIAISYINSMLSDINTYELKKSMRWVDKLLINLPDTIKSTIPQNLLTSGALRAYIDDISNYSLNRSLYNDKY